uniref:Uncharacterized protein n=1 Tax=Ananas comosus var. bracteatus TaxID=296719 RepID=A0A6V7PS78_ANACO|nr:unnamed protein product [Ananas comosus var. bracteatus]
MPLRVLFPLWTECWASSWSVPPVAPFPVSEALDAAPAPVPLWTPLWLLDPSAGFGRSLCGLLFHLRAADRVEASRFHSGGRAFWSTVMASHPIVEINFQRLLRNICAKFSLPPPRYGITVGSGDQFCAFVDVQVPRCSRFMEVITCWGSPSCDSILSANEAARVAIEALRTELHFDIRDANYTGKIHFKNLYDSAFQNMKIF